MTLSNQKKFIFFVLCFIAFILPGCSHFNPQELKEKYSVEAINYFYETVFYEDYVGKRSPENYPNISIHYRSGTKLEGILSDSETVVGVMMFPRRLKSDIRSVAKEI